jgi:hypothetical protein
MQFRTCFRGAGRSGFRVLVQVVVWLCNATHLVRACCLCTWTGFISGTIVATGLSYGEIGRYMACMWSKVLVGKLASVMRWCSYVYGPG